MQPEEQQNVPEQAPDTEAQAAPPEPVQQPVALEPAVAPPSPRSSKLPVILAALLIVVALAVVAWFAFKPSDENGDEQSPAGESSQQEQDQGAGQEQETELITTTYVSGLEHQSTASFEHPSDWVVTQSETEVPGSDVKLKSMVIASPDGNYLHVYDRDGIGGFCDPNTTSYTLTKEIATKTENMFFKEFGTEAEGLGGVLILEPEGAEWSVPAHDALKEGESLTNTCNIFSWSTIGASAVFVTIGNGPELDESFQKLGWEDIKDDADFVKMLESMVAEDKSAQ